MGSGPTPPPESSEPLFMLGYTSLVHLVLGTLSTSSLYHQLIWSFGITPTTGMFVSTMDFQIPVQIAVSSIPIQTTITVGTINVRIGSSTPLSTSKVVTPPTLSWKYLPNPIPLHGGKPPPPYVPHVSGGTYVSVSQTHVMGASQTLGSIPSGCGQIHYQ